VTGSPACQLRSTTGDTGIPALLDIPAPVTMTERFDLEICVEIVERRSRCSGVGSSRQM
jgi:hypothetical protein